MIENVLVIYEANINYNSYIFLLTIKKISETIDTVFRINSWTENQILSVSTSLYFSKIVDVIV